MRVLSSAAALLLLLFCVLAPASCGAAEPDAAELKRMSVFLSNFTELGMRNFTAKEVLRTDNPRDMIHFGVWHNYVNNFRSTVETCKDKQCRWGSATMLCSHVQKSLRRYFGYDLKQCLSAEGDQHNSYHFDGTRYHFECADGEATYYARVQKAVKRNDGLIEMSGYLYNAEDEGDVPAFFAALAKPHTWQGKSTWAIVSFRTVYK